MNNNRVTTETNAERRERLRGLLVAMGASRRTLEKWERTRRREKPVLCGAMTRKGTACKRQVCAGKTKCRNHGGMSTGPKTAAGIEAIRESNRRRARQKLD